MIENLQTVQFFTGVDFFDDLICVLSQISGHFERNSVLLLLGFEKNA